MPATLEKTALGEWVEGRFQSREEMPNGLLEVVPLNTEQRQAVEKGLTAPLTVITGPPGTGKSQVVTALLVNAVWNGQTVLFASRNNKAVDVVEARVNGLATRPVMVRIGAKREFMARLAGQLNQLLAASSDASLTMQLEALRQQANALKLRRETADAQLNALLKQRNLVVALSDHLQPLRALRGEAGLRGLQDLPADTAARVERLGRASDRLLPRHRSTAARLFWPLLRRRREAALTRARSAVNPIASLLCIPFDDASDLPLAVAELRRLVALLPYVAKYLEAANSLAALPRLRTHIQ